MQYIKKSKREFLKLLLLFIAVVLPWIIGFLLVRKTDEQVRERSIPLVNFSRDTTLKADHSQFPVLQQEFNEPQEVTEACLSCHNKTAQDVMRSSHWTWTKDYVMDSGDTMQLGKQNIINNFCIGVSSNESRCTSCHIGYGWEDDRFDFNESRNIDCIICHDRTGTYKKFPTGAGYPVTEEKKFGGQTFLPPDYSKIAQQVGSPGRENCGACHFVGGGGNNVKHGDIANDLVEITRNVDVHMAVDGANMTCTECHRTEHHNITGNLYSIASVNNNRVTCDQCHTSKPHQNSTLNKHVSRVACQTCHIPEFAKRTATKMYWDWSTAGRLDETGKPLEEHDSLGNVTYLGKKGSFVWENSVEPEYYWFNGQARHHLLGDQVDPDSPVQLNTLVGDYQDKHSRIVPVKVHRGRQIYDPVNKTLVLPHLYGKDSTAYWKGFDWDRSAEAGMKSAGMPYSGEHGFIATEMYWPINHMVAPAEESLHCSDCHSREGRLSNLAGFYLSGRDHHPLMDLAGFAMIIAAFIGVIIHSMIRINSNRRSS
ncbi:MAG: tetrathionate reductase family octaheme c-type cytochrome [Bacteroidota bacterium]